MKKKFKKGMKDIIFHDNSIIDWVIGKLDNLVDNEGNLQCDIEIEMREVNEK